MNSCESSDTLEFHTMGVPILRLQYLISNMSDAPSFRHTDENMMMMMILGYDVLVALSTTDHQSDPNV